MSPRHDGYDGWPVEDPGTKEWVVRIYLREYRSTVRASAALTVGGFRVEGQGSSDSEESGVDEARQLAAGEALLDVAGALIGSHGDTPLPAKAH
jgi:hypothetical protein